MLATKNINFKSRTLLTGEMLETIYKFPKEILKFHYADFGDGIISGLDFQKNGDEIFLTEGIVKLGEKFFISETGKINLSELFREFRENRTQKGRELYSFALCLLPNENKKNVEFERLEIKIIPKKTFSDNKNAVLFLGTFNEEGFDLYLPECQTDSKKFYEEFTDERNNFSILEIPYSRLGGTTFHPYIFAAIKKILQHKTKKTSADFIFLMQIEQDGVTSLEVIKTYIEANSEKKIADMSTRKEILKNLAVALKAVPKLKEYFTTESDDEENINSDGLIKSQLIY